MYSGYAYDKEEKLSFRLSPTLLSKIETYMKNNNIGAWDKSKAIRALIDAGLSIPAQSLHNGGQETKENEHTT